MGRSKRREPIVHRNQVAREMIIEGTGKAQIFQDCRNKRAKNSKNHWSKEYEFDDE